MHQLLVMLAHMMPMQDVLEKLEGSLNDHKANPTEDTQRSLGTACILFTTKVAIQDRPITEVLEDVAELEKTHETMAELKETLGKNGISKDDTGTPQ